jgi:hypothetical protein
MKNIILIFVLILATKSLSYGSENGNGFILQLQGGISPAVAQVVDNNLGYGFDFLVGRSFSPEFTLGLECGYYNFPFKLLNAYGAGRSVIGTIQYPPESHIPIEVVGQYNLDVGFNLKPYLLLGLGIAFDNFGGTALQTVNGNTTNITQYPMQFMKYEIEPGLGIACPISNESNVFVQSKFELEVRWDDYYIYLPIQFGINYKL